MRKILIKEIKLSASLLSYFFILFGLMFFLPGYPVLCGVFFVTLGIFKSFENTRETNDILFSSLLPIAKRDVVKGKFLFSGFIEAAALLLIAVVTFIRMTALSTAAVYRQNALMNANLFALGMAFALFGLFNLVFIGGFFRTAYRTGSFIVYTIIGFVIMGIAESLHHFPGLGFLNAFGFDYLAVQLALLLAGIVIYILLTLISYNRSCRSFETIDL